MDLLQIVSLLLTLTALFSYINHRWVKLPTSIGVMAIAMFLSLGLLLLDFAGVAVREFAAELLERLDFDAALMQVMLSFLLFAGALQAAPPVLKNLEPHGGQTGQTFALTLVGDYLRPDAEIITTLPVAIEPVKRAADAKDLHTRLPLMVTVQADAAVGVYPVRIRTA